jgi:ArsR family transcriptional regulator, lead/cadmium/zinc/bismuth-responsive transcriptional repressor
MFTRTDVKVKSEIRREPSMSNCEIDFVDEERVAKVRRAMKSERSMIALAEMFKVLGDPTRIKLVIALSAAELCVCDLANLLGASQSAVSHSLRALRQMKLVKFRKEGKVVYYSLDDHHISHLIEDGMRHVEEPRPFVIESSEELEAVEIAPALEGNTQPQVKVG